MFHQRGIFAGGLLLAASIVVAGCAKEGPATAPSPGENLSLSAGIVHQLARVAHGGLEIDTAKILVRKIRFRPLGEDASSDVTGGPVVLRLVPGNPVSNVVVARITPGLYDRLKFDIHKPEDFEVPPDPEFRDGPSGNQRYSLIVKGRFNDSAFVYRSRAEFEIELQLNPPLNVLQDGMARITFTFDPYACFGHHGLVFDPRSAANAPAIDPSIKGAFIRAFRDDDRNGEPD